MKRYEELTFTDDYMFCKILQENEDLCKRFVEVIINKKIGKIIHNEKQRAIDFTSDGRGIRMDVLLEDDEHTVYNIEMQNINPKNIGKRARYYQGMLDVNYMERGWDFNELKNSYIIFINMFDMFDCGLPKYTFTYRCHEKPDLEMGDETTKIFLNAKGICDRIEPELKSLLTYLCDGQATSDLTEEIDTQVVKARANPRWKGDFMTLYEHYQIERANGRREGLQEGRQEGLIQAVDNAIKNGLSAEDACKLIGVSADEYKAYKGN